MRAGGETSHQGEHGGVDLTTTLYGELRKLASARMASERMPQTLQATALVNEAWLRLGADNHPDWASRAQFFSVAAEAMRRILIDRARRRQAMRHGGGQHRVETDVSDLDVADSIHCAKDDELLIALHEALEAFTGQHHEAATLIKLRYFVGMTVVEAAAAMGISKSTADRRLAFARAWLKREIERQSEG
jgi:RNA polymerase sigma factor (TIGR02999 family)